MMTTQSTTEVEAIIAHQQDLLKESNANFARLFNLIIYSPNPSREEYMWDYVRTVTNKFPCRVIFVQSNDEAGIENLTVKVNNTFKSNDNGQPHCDQIYIQVDNKQLSRIPFLLYPLIVPDLPIFLLWGQDPTLDTVILPTLQKYATRLIFDSGCAESLHLYSERMLTLMKTVDVETIDLNWAFCAGWRYALARIFDSPQKIHQLKNARSIKISYNGKQAFKNWGVQAFYFQAWLMTQLRLEFSSIPSQNTQELTYSSGPQRLRVVFDPQNLEEAPAGAILSIEIDTSDDCNYIIYSLPKLSRVIVHVTCKDQCELPFTIPLPNFKRGFTFVNEIFYQPTGLAYQNMLQTISKIKWKF